jgi:hypothetical protein
MDDLIYRTEKLRQAEQELVAARTRTASVKRPYGVSAPRPN